MIQPRSAQSGFTAVELLITLFIAALFLLAGYQLFNVILTSGATARSQALASTTADTYLQQYSDSATTPCSASTPLSNSSITVSGLSNTRVTVAITCPVANTPNLSKISATVTYGVGTDAGTVNRTAFKGTSP